MGLEYGREVAPCDRMSVLTVVDTLEISSLEE